MPPNDSCVVTHQTPNHVADKLAVQNPTISDACNARAIAADPGVIALSFCCYFFQSSTGVIESRTGLH